MVKRMWRGWTTPENADRYEKLLKEEILPGIAAKDMPGYRGIEVLRHPVENGEVEFVTLMSFESLESVKDFMGEDYAVAHVPEKARALLQRFDSRSRHYEVRDERAYDFGSFGLRFHEAMKKSVDGQRMLGGLKYDDVQKLKAGDRAVVLKMFNGSDYDFIQRIKRDAPEEVAAHLVARMEAARNTAAVVGIVCSGVTGFL